MTEWMLDKLIENRLAQLMSGCTTECLDDGILKRNIDARVGAWPRARFNGQWKRCLTDCLRKCWKHD
eukprot:11193039-Lingulodinium_polyedra.AAC.1